MPVPLAPYPTPPPAPPPPPPPYTSPPANGAQSQLVCSGCRNLLLYPVGATSVCCAVCNAVTAVPPPGTEMAQLVCGGCHTLLMYIRGATSVQCSCCHTVNLALEANQVAHVNCGNCRMLLMYQYGARSVKCAVCNFVTSVGVSTTNEFLLYIAVYKSFLMYSKWGQIIIKKITNVSSFASSGPGEHPRTEIQQLKVIIHYYCKMLRTSLGLHLKLQEFSSNISSLLVRRENFLAPSHLRSNGSPLWSHRKLWLLGLLSASSSLNIPASPSSNISTNHLSNIPSSHTSNILDILSSSIPGSSQQSEVTEFT
ncbi:unnamed protein product [Malus baccata var. baccata]